MKDLDYIESILELIEKGKYADIIAVEGNPLKNIEVMDSVAMVMKGDVFVKAKGLFGSSTS